MIRSTPVALPNRALQRTSSPSSLRSGGISPLNARTLGLTALCRVI
jgi:hypothetical protein